MTPELLKETITELLSLLSVEIESITVTSGHRTVVAISSPDAELLIGADGETLRALNSIAHRMIETKYGIEAGSFLIDVNGHHEAQMEKVREAARILAQRTRLFKQEVELGPMSAYERLVIHELFAEDPDIKTESQGEGKLRHVVLKHKAA